VSSPVAFVPWLRFSSLLFRGAFITLAVCNVCCVPGRGARLGVVCCAIVRAAGGNRLTQAVVEDSGSGLGIDSEEIDFSRVSNGVKMEIWDSELKKTVD